MAKQLSVRPAYDPNKCSERPARTLYAAASSVPTLFGVPSYYTVRKIRPKLLLYSSFLALEPKWPRTYDVCVEESRSQREEHLGRSPLTG